MASKHYFPPVNHVAGMQASWTRHGRVLPHAGDHHAIVDSVEWSEKPRQQQQYSNGQKDDDEVVPDASAVDP